MLRRMIAPVLIVGLVGIVSARQAPPATPQSVTVWAPHTVTPEKIDTDMIAKIRAEGMERSQIMRIEHMLADVYGPRLTGSPNHENAGKWAIKEMESWGLKNGKMEPWDWGHEGWLNERATGVIISPVKDTLVMEVLGWTPSTKGTVTGQVINLTAPTNPTAAQMTAWVAENGPKVKGMFVLTGEAQTPRFNEVEPAKRRADDVVKASYLPPDPKAPPDAGRGGNRGGGGGGGNRGGGAGGTLSGAQVLQQFNDMLMANGALVRINDAARQHGQIIAFNAAGYDSSKTIPTVVLRNEDYGRIARILADKVPVTLEMNIVNHVYPEGKTSYNATAEFVGTDKADEVVMLGGHLDSWQSATGATDNAIGCAIMMEAVRILKAAGATPRRTIRVALWGGEEEGLLGSKAYVAQHFGTFENPKPEFAKLSAYWNIDTGTGKVRGASIFGPAEGGIILAQFLKPFEDYGIFGASTGRSRTPGGTDSTSFNQAGLPGIGGSQDPIEYNSHTHHTNLDTYERILPDDVKKNAIVTAAMILHIANRDKLMPRFTAQDMPAPTLPPPGGRGGQQ